jgi:hypothetical protein
VVKALNHLQPHLLAGDPQAEGGKLVQFPCGPLPALHLVKFG